MTAERLVLPVMQAPSHEELLAFSSENSLTTPFSLRVALNPRVVKGAVDIESGMAQRAASIQGFPDDVTNTWIYAANALQNRRRLSFSTLTPDELRLLSADPSENKGQWLTIDTDYLRGDRRTLKSFRMIVCWRLAGRITLQNELYIAEADVVAGNGGGCLSLEKFDTEF